MCTFSFLIVAAAALASTPACGDPSCDDKYEGYEITPAKPDCLVVEDHPPAANDPSCHAPLRVGFVVTNRCQEAFTSSDLVGLTVKQSGSVLVTTIAPGASGGLSPSGYMRPLAFQLGEARYELHILYEE